MDLVIPLSPRGDPLYRQVYSGLRQAILTGTFAAGQRMPSSRDLAEQLGISRTVVVLAYDQLLAEGFVTGRTGSGTYVADGLTGRRVSGDQSSARIKLSRFGTFPASVAST